MDTAQQYLREVNGLCLKLNVLTQILPLAGYTNAASKPNSDSTLRLVWLFYALNVTARRH